MRAYIGLGSNLGDPIQQVQTAIAEITALDGVDTATASSLYSSPPMGPQDQPDYINAVLMIDTDLAPHDLLDALQNIEQGHGRQRIRHWGERTLDLDVIVYGDVKMVDDRLTLPHPGVADRAFVLCPLAELAPNLDIPGYGQIDQLVAACDQTGLTRLDKSDA